MTEQPKFRTEHDSMGDVQVPYDAKYRAQTQRAVENFPISGTPIEPALVAALGSTDRQRLSEVLDTSARGTQRAAPVGPLRQLRTAQELQPSTPLTLRAHLAGERPVAPIGQQGAGGVRVTPSARQQLDGLVRELHSPAAPAAAAPAAGKPPPGFVRPELGVATSAGW